MREKTVHAMIDQVRVTRDGDDAIIEYADPEISGTRLTIGPQITTMTDRDIVDVFNGVMAAQEHFCSVGIRLSWRYSRASDKSSTTRKATSGYRAVTCSAASLTMADPMAKSLFISTTRSCPSMSSGGYFVSMPVGACGSPS
jgi:hypothetical protein